MSTVFATIVRRAQETKGRPLDVTGVGILVVDILARPVRRVPGPGELELVDQVEVHVGGCPHNTGVDLAKLGFNVAVIGKVGSDAFAETVLASLREHGVATEWILRDPEQATSLTLALIYPEGDRGFIHYAGANGALRLEEVAFEPIARSRVVHVAGTTDMAAFDGEPSAQLLRRAREAGLVTVLDPISNARVDMRSLLTPCLPYVDLFLPNVTEAELTVGRKGVPEMAEALLALGARVVGLKMGKEGSYVRTADAELWVPAFPVEVVDASGAGDAYVAGFVAGVLQGWDLEETARFASAVGATCVTAIGTTPGVRSLAETLAFMKSREEGER